ncbi:MAG: S9 family peptidase [Pelomonas sp.]|nr:S9 family peptidase [Roseateles sp.]
MLPSPLLALCCALALSCATVRADAPPPAAAFFAKSQLGQAKLSPSGKRLAFESANASGRVGLVILDLEDRGKLYPAGLGDADVIGFDWVGDDRLVFSAVDLHKVGSDRSAPGLFSVMYNGERFRELVHTTGSFVQTADDSALRWNHLLLDVPRSGTLPDEVIVGRLLFADRHLDAVEPVWLNVRTGASRDLEVGRLPPGVKHWWFDSAGHPRALYASRDGQGSYWWRGPDDEAWRRIASGPVLDLPFSVAGVDDAGHLYVRVSRGAGGTAELARFDFAKMAPADKSLVAVPGFDLDGSLLHGEPGAALLGVRLDVDAETTAWFDPAMRAFQAEVDARLPGHVNRIACRRCGAPDMVAIVRSYSDQDPGTLYAYTAADRHWTRVIAAQKDIDPRRMATVALERIKARDGRDLPVWLTLPPGAKPGEPRPAVVMVHGGPWVREGHWRWDATNQFLASRGYLVIAPDFRGSTGYGDAHYRAGFKQWGQAMEADLADALRWAEAKGLAQKGRACIMGASYGGYAALMGPVRDPALYRCAIAYAAVTDFDLFLKGNWWVGDDLSDEGRRYGLSTAVGDTQADAAMLAANSPLLQARQMHAPVLLGWGERDLRVPIEHGERLRAALTAAGNPPVWVSYPDEGHSLADTAVQIDYAERVEAFLEKNLH